MGCCAKRKVATEIQVCWNERPLLSYTWRLLFRSQELQKKGTKWIVEDGKTRKFRKERSMHRGQTLVSQRFRHYTGRGNGLSNLRQDRSKRKLELAKLLSLLNRRWDQMDTCHPYIHRGLQHRYYELERGK